MEAPSQQISFDESAEDLFENAPCGYLSTTPDGTLVRVNQTFLRWTGYERAELIGVKRFQDLLSVGGQIYHETHFAPLLQMQGIVREVAVDVVAAGGERLPVLVNSVLVRDSDGTPRGVRTTVVDVTERKLYEQELLGARDREKDAREQTERLQRITALLAAAPDARAIASALTRELVPALGARRGAVALRDPETGELHALVGPESLVEDHAVRVPLGTIGELALEFGGEHHPEPGERAFLTSAAAQAALALERAQMHQMTADVAHSLQRSLLRNTPPADPRFQMATLYRPAIKHLEVGGDWFDSFLLPGGTLGVSVGDVVGRGLGAASAMGQLRSAVRALAAADFRPAAVLEHLDTYVEQVEAARYATLAYAEIDLATGQVVFAAAGHPPPVLLDAAGEPALFMDGRSAPLGVTAPGVSRDEARFALEPGAGFLLYTDGLVERRSEPIDVGLERVLAAVRSLPGATPAQQARTLPDLVLEPGSADDDVCLLSFRLLGG